MDRLDQERIRLAADAIVRQGLSLEESAAMMKRAIVQSSIIKHGSMNGAARALTTHRNTIYRILAWEPAHVG